jgi:DNA-binding Lrp family transcriptional regulator
VVKIAIYMVLFVTFNEFMTDYCMDMIDQRIVQALQRDAGRSNSKLAERLGISPSTCLRRVERLKKDGVITGIVARISPQHAGRPLTAVVSVTLDQHGPQRRIKFVQYVKRHPAITQVYSVTGDVDIILVMRLRDMQEFQQICDSLFDNDPNVTRFSTCFAIETLKEDEIPVAAG